ncbi:MAG: hypothetical protein ACKV1O_08725 [Saprospiraceae bacterium]
MKTKKSLIGIMTIMTLTMGFVKPKDWFLLKSEAFQIEFPKEPDATTEVIDSEIGALEMKIFIHDASQAGTDDNLVYMAAYIEYPDTLISSEKTDKIAAIFRSAIDGMVNNVAGKLLSESEIVINGFPGREIKIDFGNGLAIFKVRFYLIEHKMYVIQTVTETGKFPNKSVDRFLDSFKLIN